MPDENVVATQAPSMPPADPYAGARASASERLASSDTTPHVEAPQQAQPQAEQPAQQPVQQPPPEQPDFAYEYEHAGQKFQLSKDDVNGLIARAIEYEELLRRAQDEQAQIQQEEAVQKKEEPQQAPTEDLPPKVKDALERLDRIERVQADRENKELIDGLRKEIDEAWGSNEFCSKIPKDQARFWQGVAAYVKGIQPQTTGKQAVAFVAKQLKGFSEGAKQQYVEQKVTQAANRVEGSGGASPATTPKKLGAKDLASGAVLRSARDRVAAMMLQKAGGV